jgi:autotransporter-associated beta strand protein
MPCYAQVGTGWTQTSFTKKIHLDDYADLQTFNWSPYQSVLLQDGSGIAADYTYNSTYNTETFRIFSTESNRSEIRLQNDYTSGIWQFEGYVTFDAPLNDESLFQIFGNSGDAATYLMMRGYSANGGEIRVMSGSNVIASGIYGQEVKINVIHQQNVSAKFYVNDQFVYEKPDTDYYATNYWKYGVYGTTHGLYPTVQWRAVRTFSGGYAPNLPSGVWMTDAAASWGTSGNWSTGVVSDGIGAIADFSQTNITANRTITLDSHRTVGTIKFADSMNEGSPSTAKSYTIDSPTNALILRTSSGTPVIDVIYGQSHSINAILAGTQGFTKTGAGVIRLGGTGANAVTGAIQVNGGTLWADKADAFNGQTVTLADGTQVYHNAAGTFTSTYNIQGMGVLESDGVTRFGTIRIGTNGVVISGPVNLTGDSAISARSATTTGGTISGRITGSHAIKFNHTSSTTSAGNGILTISNPGNDWTGSTTISDGTLKLGASEVIPNGAGKGNVTLVDEGTTGAANTVLDLNGFSETINGLYDSGTNLAKLIITNNGSQASKLTVGSNNASGSYGGTLSDGTSQLAIEKIGTGTQVISGTNAYSGATTITGGTLKAGNGAALGSAASGTTVVSGATLDVNGQGLGAEAVTVQGGGVGGAGAIVNSSGKQINALKTVILSGNTTFGGTSTPPGGTDFGRWDIRATSGATLSTGGQAYTLSKVGVNQVSLVATAVDAALGDININQGILAFQTSTSGMGDPNKTVTIASGAALNFYSTSNVMTKKAVLNGGTIWGESGTGAQNTFAGPITANSQGGVFDAGGNLVGGTTVKPTAVLNLSGPITGAGGITKTGPGTVFITGSIGYDGNTAISDGTLQVNTGNATVMHAVSGAGNLGVDNHTVLTVDSLMIGTLTVGPGSEVILAPLTGALSGFVTPVPEPLTVVMLLSAALALPSLRRALRRRI